MHTILTPLDFSKASMNAAKYAVDMFKNQPTRFVLLNVFSYSSPTEGMGSLKRKMKEGIEADLSRAKDELENLANYPGHTFETKFIREEAVRGIVDYASTIEAHAIFMGTTGASGLKEKLMGSIASGVVKNATCPVMAIPKDAIFSSLKRIVLATDYKPLKDKNPFEYLANVLKLSNAELVVLNVNSKKEQVTMEQTMTGVVMENFLEKIPHRYEFVTDDDPIEAILEFITKHDADLVAMIRHDYALIQGMFKRSTVEKVAMHTSVPLLSLPEVPIS